MISKPVLGKCLARLGMMRGFPIKDAVIAEVAALFVEICDTDDEGLGLVKAVWEQNERNEWPGPRMLYRLAIQTFAGCDSCRSGRGHRVVFRVEERQAAGDVKVHEVQSKRDDASREKAFSDLSSRYPASSGHKIELQQVPCDCSLGRAVKAFPSEARPYWIQPIGAG